MCVWVSVCEYNMYILYIYYIYIWTYRAKPRRSCSSVSGCSAPSLGVHCAGLPWRHVCRTNQVERGSHQSPRFPRKSEEKCGSRVWDMGIGACFRQCQELFVQVVDSFGASVLGSHGLLQPPLWTFGWVQHGATTELPAMLLHCPDLSRTGFRTVSMKWAQPAWSFHDLSIHRYQIIQISFLVYEHHWTSIYKSQLFPCWPGNSIGFDGFDHLFSCQDSAQHENLAALRRPPHTAGNHAFQGNPPARN